MSSAWVAPDELKGRPTGLPTRAIAKGLLWLGVFLGGFVMFEPAPYEVFLALLIPGWLLLGLTVPRTVSPLIVLMLLFLAGGVMAATQAKDFSTQPIYYAVTRVPCFQLLLLRLPDRRGPSRVSTRSSRAWIAAAFFTTLLGVIGYFGLAGDLFTKFGRADRRLPGSERLRPVPDLAVRRARPPRADAAVRRGAWERHARPRHLASAYSSPSRAPPGG